MKRDLVGLGGEWRTRARDGGVETGGGDSSEVGSVIGCHRCQRHPGLQGQRRASTVEITTAIIRTLLSFVDARKSDSFLPVTPKACDSVTSNIF